jgi:tRNA-2-methylthio-N6-dimethylallyladenosine synthase
MEKTAAKKLHITTYGCQMNLYDSEKITQLLEPHGFSKALTQEEADLILLNTCNIREKASEKVHSELGRIAQIKKENPKLMVVVAGCVGQAEGENIISRSPCVDIVVGPQSYHNLPELIEKAKRLKSWVVDLDFYENEKFDKIKPKLKNDQFSAFLSVQEGCDKFCHFCIVPYTRGAEFSRPMEEIYREALTLATSGCKEITLLGQNVSGYHGLNLAGEVVNLTEVIKLISQLPLERIRYTTSHPNDMVNSGLIEAHKTCDKLMPYLHLPVQSGSSKILKAMNRKHDKDFYLNLIKNFRQARPDLAFSSDFIVGYPGETEEDFQDTLSLVEEVFYAQAYSFKYSPRPGTPGSVLKNQVPEEIKDERLQRLQVLLRDQQLKFNQSKLGQKLKVLLEKEGKYPGQLVGKSEYLQSVVIDGANHRKGDLVEVEITQANQNSLLGKVVS